MIHPRKPIQDVALDCGFSSPAVFSRAIRNYFGHSPEQLRQLSHRQRMTILHDRQPHHATSPSSPGQPEPFVAPDIQIVLSDKVSGIYQFTAFDDPAAIRRAFQTLNRFACTNGIESPSLYGILSPLRRNSYRAFLPITSNREQRYPNSKHSFPVCEISGGTFASFSVYWVIFKLLINLLSLPILLLHTRIIDRLAIAATVANLTPADLHAERIQLVVAASASLAVLLIAALLSFYKPRGLTPYANPQYIL